LASLAVLCIVGVIVQLVGGNWNRFLTLGSGSQDPAKISEALKQCASDAQRGGWGQRLDVQLKDAGEILMKILNLPPTRSFGGEKRNDF
jgi:hypothetical protein